MAQSFGLTIGLLERPSRYSPCAQLALERKFWHMRPTDVVLAALVIADVNVYVKVWIVLPRCLVQLSSPSCPVQFNISS